jgi:hypothetical protein
MNKLKKLFSCIVDWFIISSLKNKLFQRMNTFSWNLIERSFAKYHWIDYSIKIYNSAYIYIYICFDENDLTSDIYVYKMIKINKYITLLSNIDHYMSLPVAKWFYFYF